MAERADARRNRERLLEVATQALAAPTDRPISLEAVARGAGVGIGTLYRHFPTREALIEAVYRAELADVSASASQLLAQYPPDEALRRWLDRYAEFVATKRGMAESLLAIFDSGAVERSETRTAIISAVDQLLGAGVAAGSLRSDVHADDIASGLLGIFLASKSPDQLRRLIGLLLDALVTRR